MICPKWKEMMRKLKFNNSIEENEVRLQLIYKKVPFMYVVCAISLFTKEDHEYSSLVITKSTINSINFYELNGDYLIILSSKRGTANVT